MSGQWISQFLRLYFRPLSAISSIIDEGSWLFALVLVGVLSLLLQVTVFSHVYGAYEAVYRHLEPAERAARQKEYQAALRAMMGPAPAAARTLPTNSQGAPPGVGPATEFDEEGEVPDFVIERKPLPLVGNYGWWFISFAPGSFFSTILGTALLYVPCLILVVTMTDSVGSFGVVLRRDYGPLLTCVLMVWAAAHLPIALAGLAIPRLGLGSRTALLLWSVSAVWFALLVALVLRTLFGVRFDKGLVIVSISAAAFVVQTKLFAVVSPFLFSPFLLFYAFSMFRGDIGDIGFSLRQRQSFRRSMEAATINPRNAEAHYQLGLIFLQRRQYHEATERLKRAIEIDPSETDAQYQLGRIARIQNRLQEALNYFSAVIEQDSKHSHHEVWREIGLTYFNATMYREAEEALQRFVEQRPYDPEALYYYGLTLKQIDSPLAREMFERCIEAVGTMPSYRQGQVRKWRKMAQQQLSPRAQAA
jgi:Tfp pilus assembly protein PilF